MKYIICFVFPWILACGSASESSEVRDAGTDTAIVETDKCIETSASIAACARELLATGWTADGCVGIPEKRLEDGGVEVRANRDGCVSRTNDRNQFLSCCP